MQVGNQQIYKYHWNTDAIVRPFKWLDELGSM